MKERIMGKCNCINPLAKLDLINSIDSLIIRDQQELKNAENSIKRKEIKEILKTEILKDRAERITLLREDIRTIPDC